MNSRTKYDIFSTLFPQDAVLPTDSESLSVTGDPLVSSGTAAVYLMLAESVLFLQGFEQVRPGENTPAVLRGSIILRLLRPEKIKTITASFIGETETNWPEGIPPKRKEITERNILISNKWKFFDIKLANSDNLRNGGASIYKSLEECFPININNINNTNNHLQPTDINELKRSSLKSASISISSHSHGRLRSFTHRPSIFSRNRTSISGRSVFSKSGTSLISHKSDSSDDNESIAINQHHNIRKKKSRSFSVSSSPTTNNFFQSNIDINDQSYHIFQPGDYIYNFELPLDSTLPESISLPFGKINYKLNVEVQRAGTFKSNMSGSKEVLLVRTPSDTSVEDSEPVMVMKNWENRLTYDVAIGGKSFAIGSYIPLAIKLTPLSNDFTCSRIMVYITEHVEYFCRKKKVHRIAPQLKDVVMVHHAPKGKSLAGDLNGIKELSSLGETNSTGNHGSSEFEFQIYIPEKLKDKGKVVFHPHLSTKYMKVYHWINIVLRLSRKDENNPQRTAHLEVDIDSPIQLLSKYCTKDSIGLPSYNGSNHNNNQSFNVNNYSYSESTNIEVENYYRNAFKNSHLESNIYSPRISGPIYNYREVRKNSKVEDNHEAESVNVPLQAIPMSNFERPIHLLRQDSAGPPPYDSNTRCPPNYSEN